MNAPKHLKFAIIATDVALFSYIDKQLCVRLIDCKNEIDFPKMRCLPGGLIHINEDSDTAAGRVLKEKANIKRTDIYLEQYKTYSRVNRDPRGRVLAVGYVAVINEKNIEMGEKGMFVPIQGMERLAYDHNEIIKDATIKLQELLMSTNIIFKLIPNEFTVAELKEAWEIIMKKQADKRNFLKKLKAEKALKDTKKQRKEGAHRPASIFTHPHKTLVKQAFF